MKPMIFLNVGWMQKYQGLSGDSITGGGAHVQEHGEGCEMFNFKPYEGYMYGFVRVKGSINIERLGAFPLDNSIDGVLVIWVARSPSDGTVIVGWYENATVYRDCQPPPESSGRERKGRREWGYRVIAKAEDCRLLPVGQREFRIPRGGKGTMGQANVWYADQSENAPFKQKVWEYIAHGRLPSVKKPVPKKGLPQQPDPYRRQRIEKKAVELIVAHYKGLGYSVDSVERDNVGWDLEARFDDRLLRIEAKGLSQKELVVGLTPNEYAKMQEYRDSYRLCIVMDALGEKPELRRFAFSPESGDWEDDESNRLVIEEIVSARISIRNE